MVGCSSKVGYPIMFAVELASVKVPDDRDKGWGNLGGGRVGEKGMRQVRRGKRKGNGAHDDRF